MHFGPQNGPLFHTNTVEKTPTFQVGPRGTFLRFFTGFGHAVGTFFEPKRGTFPNVRHP